MRHILIRSTCNSVRARGTYSIVLQLYKCSKRVSVVNRLTRPSCQTSDEKLMPHDPDPAYVSHHESSAHGARYVCKMLALASLVHASILHTVSEVNNKEEAKLHEFDRRTTAHFNSYYKKSSKRREFSELYNYYLTLSRASCCAHAFWYNKLQYLAFGNTAF